VIVLSTYSAVLLVAAVIAAVGTVIALVIDGWNLILQRKNASVPADIARLAAMQQTSIEDERRRKPEPALGIALEGRYVDRAEWELADPPALAVDQIVKVEIDAALRTLPAPRPKPTSPLFASLGAISSLGEISDFDRERFQSKVSDYADDLREWLDSYAKDTAAASRVVRFIPVVLNTGQVAASDLVIQLELPEGLTKAPEFDDAEPPPDRPKFQPTMLAGLYNPRLNMPYIQPRFPSGGLLQRDTWGPTFDRSGRRVEYKLTKAIQGVPRELDDLRLSAAPGEHVIEWEIHGSNVPESVKGQLTIVAPESTPTDRTITSMAELIPEPPADDDD
jgi:hypothetical protein